MPSFHKKHLPVSLCAASTLFLKGILWCCLIFARVIGRETRICPQWSLTSMWLIRTGKAAAASRELSWKGWEHKHQLSFSVLGFLGVLFCPPLATPRGKMLGAISPADSFQMKCTFLKSLQFLRWLFYLLCSFLNQPCK